MADAREVAAELGCRAVSPGVGAVLAVLATTLPARATVEVGTGAGVSGLRLLDAMPADGVLTTIDVEPEHLVAARRAFSEAGHRLGRTRVIYGDGLDVLPRLADAAYDLVHVDVDEPASLTELVEHAIRLLRPRGALVLSDALARDQVPDPVQRDPRTTATRETLHGVLADGRLEPALLATGDGLLVAARLPG